MQVSANPGFGRTAPLLFAAFLVLVSWHAYHYPAYGIDMLGYMENVAALETSNPREIQSVVYSEVRAKLPEGIRRHLLGVDSTAPAQQNASLKDRASNPYHFTEFLPCFAIRPLYIEFLHLFRRLGMGLVEATILGSVLPYMALSALIFIWSARYVGPLTALLFASLFVITPPIANLGRMTEPDCLSTLCACLGLYVIFELDRLVVGLAILLSCIYIRTDNVLLALFVILYLSVVSRKMEKWKGAVLAILAVASVFVINHFAGDYGWRMLYYRGFIAAPIAPGEFDAHFSFADYKHVLRSGITDLINGNFVTYLMFGVISYLAAKNQVLGRIFLIVLAFSAVHFVLFPLVEDRYFALYYVVTGLTAIGALSAHTRALNAAARVYPHSAAATVPVHDVVKYATEPL
jgi:hypothetical protein